MSDDPRVLDSAALQVVVDLLLVMFVVACAWLAIATAPHAWAWVLDRVQEIGQAWNGGMR